MLSSRFGALLARAVVMHPCMMYGETMHVASAKSHNTDTESIGGQTWCNKKSRSAWYKLNL